jgi:tRNA pseudouridine38-40 synthase
MRILKLIIEYDGTDYVGWQRQPVGRSIQGLLEDALAAFEGGPVTVHGAGRTDAGVHALGQVASVAVTATHDTDAFQRGLNAVLPLDVRVTDVTDAPAGFHARFSAVAKTYEYRIVNASFVSAFQHRFAWHVAGRLDAGKMRAAAATLAGTHDFAAFQGAGTAVHSTVRTIHRIAVRDGGGFDRPLVVEVEGDGFLRHMVRNIAGTLVEVGFGRWPVDRVFAILESRDRMLAGPTAPPAGLFLVEVRYSAHPSPSP